MTLVESELGAMDTDNVSNAVDDGEVLETLSVENESGVLSLGALGV